MSKLYDQLRNAAFSRKQALERKPRKSAVAPSSSPTSSAPARPLADQKVVDDDSRRWREEIEGKLHQADRELIGGPPPPLDDADDIRGRESTMATLAEAAQRRANAEARALERARDPAAAERALQAQSEALRKADREAADSA
ncbi:MAG: hypothetical protein ACXWBZ_18475, partial [Usitatibacter sp.]